VAAGHGGRQNCLRKCGQAARERIGQGHTAEADRQRKRVGATPEANGDLWTFRAR
jgi:hypothetical protein